VKALLAAAGLVVALHSASPPGPVAGAAPTVSGVLEQGKRLTATTGTWTGTGTLTYAYQWYRCDANGSHCNSIHGATGPSYTQVAKDVDGSIGVTVRATDTTGTTAAYAPLAGIVAPAGATLLAASQPTIVGPPNVGRALTVETPQWSLTATTTFAWERCNANGRACVAIPGATGPTYTAAPSDVGATLLVAVTGRAGTVKQAVLSLPTAAVQQAMGPTLAARPSIAGALQQGKRLVVRTGTWIGSSTITYAFQWYRCDTNAAHCSAIHGATKASYAQVERDVGHTLGVTVHATDSTGTATAYSPVAGVVASSASTLVVTRQPALTGSAVVGQTLTVKAGTWSSKPSSLTYAWLRCNPNGRACVPIAAATSATYAVTPLDSGHTLTASVTATAGTTVTAALAVASLPVP